MATIVTFNGLSYSVPATGEENWGGVTKVDGLLITLATNGFQKTGGLFTLSADADFGASAGLKSIYYKSRSSSPASAGTVRLGNTDSMGWRNFLDNGNLLLSVNSSNQLLYNGSTVIGLSPSLTINTAVIADGTGTIVSSVVTSTELAKLSGILSAAVGLTDSQTLTTKKLQDSSVTFVDNGDATKQFAVECSGITSGQTRTWTVPDVSSTFVGTTITQTLTTKTISNSENTLNHIDFEGTIANLSIACSVAGSALTIALKDASGADCSATSKAFINFRSSTAATGTYTARTVTAALSVVVSSGSTLGHRDAVVDYIYVYAIDTGAGVVLGVTTSSHLFDQGTVQSTTAEGGAGAADTRTVMYSTAAQTNKPCRLIARLKSTQTTAGTWASVPTEISLWPFQTFSDFVPPTLQKFTSGSGTYTTPTSPRPPLYIRVRAVGGGGGGGGSGTTSGTAATNGGASTFGTALISAGGGLLGARDSLGGTGGTSSLGTSVGLAVTGGSGGTSSRQGTAVTAASANIAGPNGGSSALGGAGAGGSPGGTGAGQDGVANTGGGGGGGYISGNNSVISGSGGGSGGFVDAVITNPIATYAYAVGSGGTGQAAGTNGAAGGAGGTGYVEVWEYYQ